MIRLVTFLILNVFIFVSYGLATEINIADSAKSELVFILNEGVRDGSISEKQSKDTLKWLQLSPCVGVKRTLLRGEKKKIIAALERQFEQQKIEILDTFKYAGWYVLFSTAGHGDAPYLFYSQSPELAKKTLNSWSGAATFFETEEIYQGILGDTPQIPKRLAQCFSWHVTLGTRL